MQLQLPANGWRPRWYQLPAWEAMLSPDIDTVTLAWHRRAGKDDIAMHSRCIRMMQRVGNYWHLLPQQEQARKALWESVNPRTGQVRWKDAFPEQLIAHVDNQAMKLTFKNGSTWQLLGSDNYNSLVGTTPVDIVFSEAALADPNAFAFFRPILLENKGSSLHISSPRGRNHFYRQFEIAANSRRGFAQRLSAFDTDVFTEEQLEIEEREYISLYGEAIGKALFEQEYLSSWDAAVIGSVFGTELRALEQEGRAQPLRYDPRYPVITSWDIGVLDATVILFWQVVGNTVRLIDWYQATDTGIEHFAEVLRQKPYFYQAHIGPHDTKNREWGAGGASRMEIARNLGIKFERVPQTAKADSIAAGSRLLKMTSINVSEKLVKDPMDDCAFVMEALRQYRFGFDQQRRVMSKSVLHDWTSHYADALMTFAVWFTLKKGLTRPTVQGIQGDQQEQSFGNVRLRQLLAQKESRVSRSAFS